MIRSIPMALLATAGLALGAVPARSETKVVLLELFTSEGCNMCPAADEFLGELGKNGPTAGPDRVVALAFHVDYFNKPWKDVHSDKRYSEREAAYNHAMKREDLYFTPMLMVDGQVPMLGTDKTKARAALKSVLAQKPGASLKLTLDDVSEAANRKTLRVRVAPLVPSLADRDLLVGVAIYRDAVTTKVESGENAGKTLVEHFPVEKFAFEIVKLSPNESKDLTFPLELDPSWSAERCGVAVFVQDNDNGRVYQAREVPWAKPKVESAGR